MRNCRAWPSASRRDRRRLVTTGHRERRLNHWVEVYGGVQEEECGAVLREFFAAHQRYQFIVSE